MNFDDALKAWLPRVWFRFKFVKYKHFGRGEAELPLLRHLIAPGSTAVDVGASFGMYMAEMARHAGKVIAFEANPEIAAFTARVAPRNVTVVNAALSDAPGRATLSIPVHPGGHAISELATIGANPHDGPTVTLAVDAKRLDDCGIENCSFIKIDVEGHEEQVLAGAGALIDSQRPAVLVEINETPPSGAVSRVTAAFAARSYAGFFLSRGRIRPVAEFDPAAHQDSALLQYARHTLPPGREFINNFLFVPNEKTAGLLARVR